MSDLPSDLLRDIFLRLPAESLLRLRSVCKQWVRIIDDSSFIRDHTHNQQHINQHTLLLLVKNGSEDTLYSFSLDSFHFTNGPQLIDAISIKVHWAFRIRSFCNGLILMDNKFDRTELVIWNPLTDERRYAKLPLQINVTGSWCDAFGYDYDAHDYKLVIIDGYRQTHVYSLKSDSWRRIQNYPYRNHFLGHTFLNGTLYYPSEDSTTLIALDLGTEIFSELPLPLVDGSGFNIWTNFELDALDGCLICSLNYTASKTFHGWVMKDKSWIKLFSLQHSLHKVSSWRLRLVAYWTRKQQVVLEHSRDFLWFDIETNSVKNISIDGFHGIDYSQICPGSLVRLDVRDSAIERKRKTERRVTRLKFCVRDVGAMCCSDNYCSCIANKH